MKKLILLVGIIFVLMFSMHINSNASATYNFVYNNCALTDTKNSVNNFHYFDSMFLNNEIISEKTESIFYDDLIYDSKIHLGKPYKWGATGPYKFDCSGFTQYIFKQNGIHIPRTASMQYSYTKSNVIAKNDCKTGDLVFFKGGRWRGYKGIDHVGIIVSNDNGIITFIHSSTKGVKISQLNESYYARKFVAITRIFCK